MSAGVVPGGMMRNGLRKRIVTTKAVSPTLTTECGRSGFGMPINWIGPIAKRFHHPSGSALSCCMRAIASSSADLTWASTLAFTSAAVGTFAGTGTSACADPVVPLTTSSLTFDCACDIYIYSFRVKIGYPLILAERLPPLYVGQAIG